MALIVQTTTQCGVAVNNSYCRVEEISIDKNGAMSFALCRYVAQGAPYPAFTSTRYNTQYSREGANVYKQAYAYLATLDEFKDATCVYEAGQPAA